MTKDELDRLDALANAATGGPWEVGDPYNSRTVSLVAVYGLGMEVADTQTERDAAFIAAARSAVPALVAEVKRLRRLAREAFDEGFAIGLDDPGNRDYWPESEVRKKLEDA